MNFAGIRRPNRPLFLLLPYPVNRRYAPVVHGYLADSLCIFSASVILSEPKSAARLLHLTAIYGIGGRTAGLNAFGFIIYYNISK